MEFCAVTSDQGSHWSEQVQPLPGSGGCRGVAEFLGACVPSVSYPLSEKHSASPHRLERESQTMDILGRLLQG